MEINWTNVDDCLVAENKIAAIREYREQTNAGLREAKVAVDKRQYDLGMLGIVATSNRNDLDKIDVDFTAQQLHEIAVEIAEIRVKWVNRATRLHKLNDHAIVLRKLSEYLFSLV